MKPDIISDEKLIELYCIGCDYKDEDCVGNKCLCDLCEDAIKQMKIVAQAQRDSDAQYYEARIKEAKKDIINKFEEVAEYGYGDKQTGDMVLFQMSEKEWESLKSLEKEGE